MIRIERYYSQNRYLNLPFKTFNTKMFVLTKLYDYCRVTIVSLSPWRLILTGPSYLRSNRVLVLSPMKSGGDLSSQKKTHIRQE